MALLGNPWSGNLDVGDPASGPDMETWLNAIRTVVNALDNTNLTAAAGVNTTKLDYGVLIHHRGPATLMKFYTGTKNVTLAGTPGKGTAAVSFTSGADVDGGAGTDFSSAPRVMLTLVLANGAAADRIVATLDSTPATTGFTICCQVAEIGIASTATVAVQWMAVGPA